MSRTATKSTTQKKIKRYIIYNPKTGIIKNRNTGEKINYFAQGDQIYLKTDQTCYSTLRTIWCYMTGEFPLCHLERIDGDSNNNKWKNIRKSFDATKEKRILPKNKKISWCKIYRDLEAMGINSTQLSILLGKRLSSTQRVLSCKEPKHSTGEAILEIHRRYCGDSCQL